MECCEHEGGERFVVCRHLLDDEDLDHLVKFTGHGIECQYICRACVDAPELVDACAECRERATGSWQGIVGTPEIAEEPSAITAVHTAYRGHWPQLTDLQPLLGADRNHWLGVTADGTLLELDVDAQTSQPLFAAGIELADPMLRVSRDGTLAAIVDRRGVGGVVVDLAARRTLLALTRDGYRTEHCVFPLAFVERDGRTLVVHAPAWNRLDVVDPRTGDVLTQRELSEQRSLDYFHCGLDVSHDQRYIADNGWVWAPVGIVTTWSLDAWLANPHESEDGPTRKRLCARDYYWDGPSCWLDGAELAVYGYGRDDEWLIAGVRIFDAATGEERRWFPGPRGHLIYDRELYAIDDVCGTTVWNAARGTRLFADQAMQKLRYHPSAKAFVSIANGSTTILRGADAKWNRGAVTALAERISRERAFEDLPVLGDALETEGCTDADVLAHCHAREPHVERCWVLDRLLTAPGR